MTATLVLAPRPHGARSPGQDDKKPGRCVAGLLFLDPRMVGQMGRGSRLPRQGTIRIPRPAAPSAPSGAGTGQDRPYICSTRS